MMEETASESFSGSLALVIMLALFVYYIVANVACFYAYREFKAIMFDQGAGGQFGMMSGAQQARAESTDSRNDAPPAAQANQPAASSGTGGFKSFQGKGVTIGGS